MQRLRVWLTETHSTSFELTRHFLRSFLSPGFLDEAGEDAMRGSFIALVASLFSLGIFLPRLFRMKYISLSLLPTPTRYQEALVGDQLVILSIPMLIVGLVAALVADRMFPDEIDYRVLTPLPITRRQLVGAKILALAIFVGVFVAAANLFLSLGFPFVSHGRWAEQPLVTRIVTHAISSVLGSIFMFGFVVAVQGLLVALVPTAVRQRLSVWIQNAIVGGLVVSVPCVASLYGQTTMLGEHVTSLSFVPPTWFWALNQWLLGNQTPNVVMLARVAGVGLAGCLVLTVLSYAILYVRLEQLASPGVSRRVHWRRIIPDALLSRMRRSASSAGTAAFTVATLSRVRLPQLTLVFAYAIGLAFGATVLLDSLRRLEASPDESLRALTGSVVAAPLMLMFVVVLGVQMAFRLPVEGRANWLFRTAEDPDLRSAQLKAVGQTFWWFGVGAPVLLLAPLQVYVLGLSSAVLCVVLTACCGALIIEIVIASWRRIPFTCSYLPAKRHLALTGLVVTTAFILFVGLTGGLIRWSLLRPSRWLTLVGLVVTAQLLLKFQRLRGYRREPLQFDDEDPDAVQQLRIFE